MVSVAKPLYPTQNTSETLYDPTCIIKAIPCEALPSQNPGRNPTGTSLPPNAVNSATQLDSAFFIGRENQF